MDLTGQWRPQARLRHLQAISLRNFSVPALPHQQYKLVDYQLSLVAEGAPPLLLYTSEQLEATPELQWDHIDVPSLGLDAKIVHEPLSQQLRVTVYAWGDAAPTSSAAHVIAAPPAAAAAEDSSDHRLSGEAAAVVADDVVLALRSVGTAGGADGQEPPPAVLEAAVAAAATFTQPAVEHDDVKSPRRYRGSQPSRSGSDGDEPSLRAAASQVAASAAPLSTSDGSSSGEAGGREPALAGEDVIAASGDAGSSSHEQLDSNEGSRRCSVSLHVSSTGDVVLQICPTPQPFAALRGTALAPTLLSSQLVSTVMLADHHHQQQQGQHKQQPETERERSPSASPPAASAREQAQPTSCGGVGDSAFSPFGAVAAAVARSLQPAAATGTAAAIESQSSDSSAAAAAAAATVPAAPSPVKESLLPSPATAAQPLQQQKLLEYDFELNHLEAMDFAAFKKPPAQLNQLIIELTDGYYSLPPRPLQRLSSGGRRHSSGSQLQRQWSLMHRGGLLPGLDRLSQQQQAYRWMLSDASLVQPVGIDSEEAATAGGMPDVPDMQNVGIRAFLGALLFGNDPTAATAGRPGAAGAASGGPGGRANGVVRQYDIRDFRAEIRRLAKSRDRLEGARGRCERTRDKVCRLLDNLALSRQQHAKLRAVEARVDSLYDQVHRQQAQEQQKRQRLQASRAVLIARATALLRGAQSLTQALQRLEEAERKLRGSEGHGAWRDLHGKLIVRSNRLVAQLAQVYSIGPMTASLLDVSPLEERIEHSWFTSTTDAAASDTGSNPDTSECATTPTALATTAAAALAAVATASAGSGGSGSSTSTRLFGVRRRAPDAARMAIAGLELQPNLGRRGIEGTVGWTGDPDEEQRAAAALGYAAHVTERLAAYLDVPLRYPLRPRVSASVICDHAPALQDNNGGGSGGGGGGGNGAASDEPGGSVPRRPAVLDSVRRRLPWSHHKPPVPHDLPLYYHGADRTRFAYAIFLLNKDIEQLLSAHGLTSAGPNHVLANLYKLVAAASSAAAASLLQPPLWLPSPATGRGLPRGGSPAGSYASSNGTDGGRTTPPRGGQHARQWSADGVLPRGLQQQQQQLGRTIGGSPLSGSPVAGTVPRSASSVSLAYTQQNQPHRYQQY